jgi:DNA adenine methylase
MDGSSPSTSTIAKPFLKWAGGKSQLLSQLRACYPAGLATGEIRRYVEPFLGGGAVFLDIVQNYPIEEIYLSDLNPELILAYTAVQRDPEQLIAHLLEHRRQYFKRSDDEQKEYFYSVRAHYNAQKANIDFNTYSEQWAVRAADLIFLNKTCFNGLFRVNARGLFNVPFGAYKNPVLFDEQNIYQLSRLLRNAVMNTGPMEFCAQNVTTDSFVYFDPPYRPLSTTARFTAYSSQQFGDAEQIALAQFYAGLHDETGAKLMLSNSDPKNTNPGDTFFDELYAGFCIRRIHANRMINSDAKGRGKITEILVTNYL